MALRIPLRPRTFRTEFLRLEVRPFTFRAKLELHNYRINPAPKA